MTPCIREMERLQRPRERLAEYGPESLSDAELIAVLLRTGRPGHGAVGEAHRLLFDAGGLVELARMEQSQLMQRPGIGEAKVATLAAAMELGRRLARAELRRARVLTEPDAAGEFLVRHLKRCRREVVGFLSLDHRQALLRINEVVVGSRTRAPVDPSELFRQALLDGATSVLLFHNHPSGELSPSADDIALTRRLVRTGAIIGIPVLDHLVVAGKRWLSLHQVQAGLFGTDDAVGNPVGGGAKRKRPGKGSCKR